MKIKKVDDKPMVIHTKQKAEIHTHEPKKASIKGIISIWWSEGQKQKAPFISQSRRIRDYQDSSETIENPILQSRPRTPIFTLQEELEYLQPGQ